MLHGGELSETDLFTDEKRFWRDGHQILLERPQRWEKHSSESYTGRRGNQGLGGFFRYEKTNLAGLIGSPNYQNVLDNNLVDLVKKYMPLCWIYMPYNAPFHTSKASMEWFRKQCISCIAWPAQSPDLKTIENIWGSMARTVDINNTVPPVSSWHWHFFSYRLLAHA